MKSGPSYVIFSAYVTLNFRPVSLRSSKSRATIRNLWTLRFVMCEDDLIKRRNNWNENVNAVQQRNERMALPFHWLEWLSILLMFSMFVSAFSFVYLLSRSEWLQVALSMRADIGTLFHKHQINRAPELTHARTHNHTKISWKSFTQKALTCDNLY